MKEWSWWTILKSKKKKKTKKQKTIFNIKWSFPRLGISFSLPLKPWDSNGKIRSFLISHLFWSFPLCSFLNLLLFMIEWKRTLILFLLLTFFFPEIFSITRSFLLFWSFLFFRSFSLSSKLCLIFRSFQSSFSSVSSFLSILFLSSRFFLLSFRSFLPLSILPITLILWTKLFWFSWLCQYFLTLLPF